MLSKKKDFYNVIVVFNMVTTNKIYVLSSAIISGIAVAFTLVSLSTEKWINGDASDLKNEFQTEKNHLNYGLFQGNFYMAGVQARYQITMTCNFKLNVCALLCGTDSTRRKDLLQKLYDGTADPETDGACSSDGGYLYAKAYYNPEEEFRQTIRNWMNHRTASTSDKKFINAGIWLSTLIFVILSTFIGLVAAGLALFNTVSNPIQFYLGVKSLFFFNGLASFFIIMYLIMWGTMFTTTTIYDAAIVFTLLDLVSTEKMVSLGYSYWINIAPLVLYLCSCGVLYYREYLNSKDPRQRKVILESSADPNIYLY